MSGLEGLSFGILVASFLAASVARDLPEGEDIGVLRFCCGGRS